MTADDGFRRMTLVVPLDRGTADRLLAGVLEPDDAPPGYTDVTRMIRALGRPPTALELRREDAALAAAVAIRARSGPSVGSGRRRAGRRSRLLVRAKVVGLVATGAIVATSGLAVAGALPDAAQNVVSDALALIGITAPSAEEWDGGPDPTPPAPPGGAAPIAPPGRVRAPEPPGAADAATRGGRADGTMHGGTATADAASGGASEHGTTIANERSDGRSAAGSGNAELGAGGHGPGDLGARRGPDGGHGLGSPAGQGIGHGPPPDRPHGPPPGHG